MKRIIYTLLLGLSLVTMSQAQAEDYCFEAREDTLIIHVQPGQTGINISRQNIVFSQSFLKWVDLANAGKAYFTVIVSNDDTKWAMLQLMKRDPNFKGLDFDELNLNFDTLAKGGRQTAADQILTLAGLDSEAQINWRFTRDKTCYFKIYAVAIKQDYSMAPMIDTQALLKDVEGMVKAATKIWSMGLYAGLSTTRHSVAPSGTAVIYYGQKLMLRGQGVHSLFLRQDRDYFGSNEPTFERAWSVATGYKCLDPFWISLGWYSEENILDAGQEAGKNLTWLDAGEIGVSYISQKLALQLGLTYGHEKDYDKELTTTFGVRFAVMVGNTWGW